MKKVVLGNTETGEVMSRDMINGEGIITLDNLMNTITKIGYIGDLDIKTRGTIITIMTAKETTSDLGKDLGTGDIGQIRAKGGVATSIGSAAFNALFWTSEIM